MSGAMVNSFLQYSGCMSVSCKRWRNMVVLAKAEEPKPKSKRPTCPCCTKPISLCLCIRIRTPLLANSVSVTILQHSHERKHALNTARIASLGLKNLTVTTATDVIFESCLCVFQPKSETCSVVASNSNAECCSNENDVCHKDTIEAFPSLYEKSVIVAVVNKRGVLTSLVHSWMASPSQTKNFSEILDSEAAMDALSKGFVVKKLQKRLVQGTTDLEEYEEFEMEVPPGSMLLYPSEKAIGLDELGGMNYKVKNLIVLDGTWGKAKRMYRENPWLKLLPHLKLDIDKVSLYSEVRRQPKAGCLSTIESIVYALKAVGDNLEDLDQLLNVFESMVVDQRRFKELNTESRKE